MGTYYIKTVERFDKELRDYFESHGWKSSREFPVNFVYVAGEHVYQRNKFDTERSDWISLLWGKSVDILTNKYELHKHYPKASFLVPTKLIRDHIPRLPASFLKILKPVEGYAGTGITIVQTKEEIVQWLEKYPSKRDWVLQDYITTPALMDGHKFHMRVLVLVRKQRGYDPEVYVGKYKLCVKAEQPYVHGDWLNPKIHDTHYSGELKLFPDALPDGWTISDSEHAQERMNWDLRHLLKNEVDFKPDWNAKNGFEVFGVDILFDKKKPYILEFNNKIGGYQVIDFYAKHIVQTVLTNKSNAYFTRIL